MKQVKLGKKEKCVRCGHEWQPKKATVRVCPKCKSPYFDIERIENAKEKNIKSK